MRRFPITALAAWLAVALVLPISWSRPALAQQLQAYRLNSLALRDPGVFIGFGAACFELTNPPGLLGINVNQLIAEFVNECNPAGMIPCTHDFNLVAVFDPLIQTPGAGGALAPCLDGGSPCEAGVLLLPECVKTATGTVCSGEPETSVFTTYSNAGAGQTCLTAFPGTTGRNNVTPYLPAIPVPTGPCFQTGAVDFTFEFGSDVVVTIPLQGLQVAATWVGDPATGLMKGLARGFLPESAADATVISVTSPVALEIRLSEALAGGADRCYGGENDGMRCTNPGGSECPGGSCKVSCAPAGGAGSSNNAQDDSDHNPPDNLNGTPGWWFYLEFAAEPVTVPEGTPRPTRTPTASPTPAPDTPTPTETPTRLPITDCVGDCGDDDGVTVDEVVTMVNIALGNRELSACSNSDTNADDQITVEEILRAIFHALNGCPV